MARVFGERGAREHGADRRMSAERRVEPQEPRLPLGLGERNARGHARLGVLLVEVVGVEERQVQRGSEALPDGRLARSRHAHHNDRFRHCPRSSRRRRAYVAGLHGRGAMMLLR